MTIFSHALIFALALGVIWILSGFIIGAVDRVADRYHKPGFAVAFFVLGILTSISEISVAVNALFEGVPPVSAGNLIGASIVIFCLIIPLLALLAGKIDLDHTITWGNLVVALCVIAAPTLVALDGDVLPEEGLLLVLLYIALIYYIHKKRPFDETVGNTMSDVRKELIQTRRATAVDFGYIIGGAFLIFLAGNILVDESIFFTNLLSVPASLAGLLVLAIGTNTPELIIAVRSALGRRPDIAFGDYLGSAAANSLIFGFLPLFNGPFLLDTGAFAISFLVLALGLSLFAIFARTKNELSRGEGVILLSLYVSFLSFQILMFL
ncbi:TPA: hypothetical protein DCL30_00850 [Candidatus Peribacteria bacterium]|nr:MAG: hypothetical protein A3J91_00850 [Candidatus Peribacteria bacterium RIFOXYC2_FULL_58_10]OGJ85185.1 MAG: hypothetical protein A2529_01845 [Candidatus Peribacteria bacterium RIFOXYD2_FULL_58_15]HAI98077.1 hypothetical protein [Candidatus Peribacteria bacterium]HAS33881.1 hypothetical protein [Candidatus Peribacteria bacterium]